jgi:hypothetical protein
MQPVDYLPVLHEPCLKPPAQGQSLIANEGVEKVPVSLGAQQRLVIMLSMDID